MVFVTEEGMKLEQMWESVYPAARCTVRTKIDGEKEVTLLYRLRAVGPLFGAFRFHQRIAMAEDPELLILLVSFLLLC